MALGANSSRWLAISELTPSSSAASVMVTGRWTCHLLERWARILTNSFTTGSLLTENISYMIRLSRYSYITCSTENIGNALRQNVFLILTTTTRYIFNFILPKRHQILKPLEPIYTPRFTFQHPKLQRN